MNSSGHVLIVDDVADNIQLAMNFLEGENYDFSFANSGKQALSIINQEDINFDLILLDIMMPEMDGYEVCRKIKESAKLKEIPIIFLTAKTDIESIKKGFALGAVDYITKPFQSDELLARVKTHVQLYRAKEFLKKQNIDIEKTAKHDIARLVSDVEEAQTDLIFMITELIEKNSNINKKYFQRVAEFSLLIGYLHPELSKNDAYILFNASATHDIGKISIPLEILEKPADFRTPEETKIFESHTTEAYNVICLSDYKLIKAAAVIAHEHHENWDGSGYPQQLKGKETHIYARIVKVACELGIGIYKGTSDAKTNFKNAIEELKQGKGTKNDPVIVDLVLENIEDFEPIAHHYQK